MAKIELYMKDEKGNYSSTRLMAYHFMWYFFIFNILFTALLIVAYLRLPPNGSMSELIMYILALDLLLLLAIFAPKQFNKVSEVRQVIEVAKAKEGIVNAPQDQTS